MRIRWLVLGAFALGVVSQPYFSEGYYFLKPYFQSETLGVSIIQSQSQSVSASPTTNEDPNKKVVYDGMQFRPEEVTIETSRRLMVLNTSKTKQMFLVSSLKELSTTRGLGETEQYVVQLNTAGTFKVTDKNNPSAILTVKVIAPK